MMIWEYIRDFFVQFIFGGVDSAGDYFGGCTIGFDANDGDVYYTGDTNFNIGNYSFSFGDWLSTTATIIVLCLFIFVLIKFTIYLFKAGAGLLKW